MLPPHVRSEGHIGRVTMFTDSCEIIPLSFIRRPQTLLHKPDTPKAMLDSTSSSLHFHGEHLRLRELDSVRQLPCFHKHP